MKETTVYIIIYALWLLYAGYEGFDEANYWWKLSGTNKPAKNEHMIWTVGRAIVALIILVPILYLTSNIWLTALFGLSLVLSFSFWHDGCYYSERNDLDGSY